MEKIASQPAQFGKYVLLEKIATGGMAELFRAKLTGAEGFEKLIVIKKILQHLNDEEKLVESFIEEAKLAAYLHHPNIVQIYDFGFMDKTYFIAMEHLSGKDLRFVFNRVLEKKTEIDFRLALYIVSKILTGLDYAHTLNDFDGKHLSIIHRDVGPQNIFITYDGQVKIIDFGIAKAANQDTNTLHGTIKGKVSYMSPEQADGDEIDHRSDVFSAGIILYELLTHSRMYEGETFQILSKARKMDFIPAEVLKENLPSEIFSILNRSLQKDVNKRYQSAEMMLKDIDTFLVSSGARISQKDLAFFMRFLFDHDSEEGQTRTLFNVNRYFSDEMPESTIITLDESDFSKNIKKSGTVKRFRFFLYALLLAVAALCFHYFNVDEQIRSYFHNQYKLDWNRKLAEKGVEMAKSRQYAGAVAAFEESLKKSSALFETYRKNYSEALTNLAETLMASDIDGSREKLEKALIIDPDNERACFLLGKVHTVLKDNEKAISYYQIAARLDPDNPDIFFNMGFNYAAVENLDKAREMYERVILQSPTFVDQAYFNLGLIEYREGRIKEAFSLMRKAVEINPLNTNAARFLELKKEEEI